MNSTTQLDGSTRLASLGLPHMDLILAERFLLPPESLRRFNMAVPETVSDLMDSTGMNLKEIERILVECHNLNADIALSGMDLDQLAQDSETWIMDMRPGVTIDDDPLHPAARLFHLGNQAGQLAVMRTLSRIVVLSHSSGHAWSAAMGLRSMGVRAFVIS